MPNRALATYFLFLPPALLPLLPLLPLHASLSSPSICSRRSHSPTCNSKLTKIIPQQQTLDHKLQQDIPLSSFPRQGVEGFQLQLQMFVCLCMCVYVCVCICEYIFISTLNKDTHTSTSPKKNIPSPPLPPSTTDAQHKTATPATTSPWPDPAH